MHLIFAASILIMNVQDNEWKIKGVLHLFKIYEKIWLLKPCVNLILDTQTPKWQPARLQWTQVVGLKAY